MNLHRPEAFTYTPDRSGTERALARSTHLGIGAHQDDLESIAIAGILQAYRKDSSWFSGVVVTDGSGAPRQGPYADLSGAELTDVRNREQIAAADRGRYSSITLLAYPSAEARDPADRNPTRDLQAVIQAARPEVLYTHSPLDKHPTHAAVAVRTLTALRDLPSKSRPSRVYGVEFWGGLDWVPEGDRVVFDCSRQQQLQRDLLEAFPSQNTAKDYPGAVLARRRANAVFQHSHQADQLEAVTYGLDLTPLVQDPTREIKDYFLDIINSYREQALATLNRFLPRS